MLVYSPDAHSFFSIGIAKLAWRLTKLLPCVKVRKPESREGGRYHLVVQGLTLASILVAWRAW